MLFSLALNGDLSPGQISWTVFALQTAIIWRVVGWVRQSKSQAEDIEVIGRNCPRLKSFTVNKVFDWSQNDEDALAIANYMPELCHLDLCGSDVTNDGLEGILIGCPRLESLDLRICCNLNLECNLGKLFTQGIKDFMMWKNILISKGWLTPWSHCAILCLFLFLIMLFIFILILHFVDFSLCLASCCYTLSGC